MLSPSGDLPTMLFWESRHLVRRQREKPAFYPPLLPRTGGPARTTLDQALERPSSPEPGHGASLPFPPHEDGLNPADRLWLEEQAPFWALRET